MVRAPAVRPGMPDRHRPVLLRHAFTLNPLISFPTESLTMTVNLEAEASAREENNAALIAALDETSPSEVDSSWNIDVLNDAERGRWLAALGPEAIGELSYRFVGGRVVLLSA